MKIREIAPDARGQAQYEVLSDSGKTYTVTYEGSGDGDPEYVALWSCTCPAGKHGRDCKHIAAVANYCEEQYP